MNTSLYKDLVDGKEYTTKSYHWNYTNAKIPAGITQFWYDMPSIYVQDYTFIASQTKRDGDITKDISLFDN